MSSLSSDGNLQAKILTRLGYFIVRGSSSKGGAKALVSMIREQKKGRDVAFAADGPKGPIYKVKPGPIYIAQKSGAAIIPVATSARAKWFLNNWDEYLIPKPFTKTVVRYGEPVYVSKDADIEKIMEDLNNRLDKLNHDLDEDMKK